MIADRWKLIGQGLLIDSTGDRWIRGLTRILAQRFHKETGEFLV
jgi:hypothetical protein